MTGFARMSGSQGETRWNWELRSVNGKSLDIRLRLPHGFEHLEAAIKKAMQGHLHRGNVQAVLTLDNAATEDPLQINQQALAMVLEAIPRIEKRGAMAPSSAAQILGLRGVMETVSPSLETGESDEDGSVIVASAASAAHALAEAREKEGAHLANALRGQIAEIDRLTGLIATDPARSSEAIRTRLTEQLQRLYDAADGMNVDRIAQEVAILATKADLTEELDRLRAHCDAANDLIDKGSPAGRQLEFLAQEFNRECNTICSKSNSIAVTQAGLEMKLVIDQVREQVLNVE